MKKLLLFTFAFGVFAASAQDDKVQIGIAYQVGMNFNKPTTKMIERDGIGGQNMIGLNANFYFNDNIGFATGLEFDFESFKYRPTGINGNTYYKFNDTKIYQRDETYNSDGTAKPDQSGDAIFQLQQRKYKNIYLTIPTMLIFRTAAIGDFRYYGKFGARTSFLLKSQMNDMGTLYATGSLPTPNSENNGMRVKYSNDVLLIRSSVGLAGGTQWNFTGNTVLFAELGFYYVFTPIHNTGSNQDNMTLTTDQNFDTYNNYYRVKASQTQLALKIGILF